MSDKERCPDGGRCHHLCAEACFRVLCCGPLSAAKYPGDTWPEDVRAEHRAADAREQGALDHLGEKIYLATASIAYALPYAELPDKARAAYRALVQEIRAG